MFRIWIFKRVWTDIHGSTGGVHKLAAQAGLILLSTHTPRTFDMENLISFLTRQHLLCFISPFIAYQRLNKIRMLAVLFEALLMASMPFTAQDKLAGVHRMTLPLGMGLR
jgi:hypothetical protein